MHWVFEAPSHSEQLASQSWQVEPSSKVPRGQEATQLELLERSLDGREQERQLVEVEEEQDRQVESQGEQMAPEGKVEVGQGSKHWEA